jgi:hypothetical protein
VINWADRSPLEQWRSIRAAARPNDSQFRGEATERAAANVEQWRQSLPADCVEAMVKDGWQRRV